MSGRSRSTKSAAIRSTLGDRATTAWSTDNLGTIFERMGRYSQALAHYEDAPTVSRELGNRIWEALLH